MLQIPPANAQSLKTKAFTTNKGGYFSPSGLLLASFDDMPKAIDEIYFHSKKRFFIGHS